MSYHGVPLNPSPGVILGLGTVCELASKYGPLVLGSRTNNLFRRNTSFYPIETNSVFQRRIKRAARPSALRCFSWIPGLRNRICSPALPGSQTVSKPRMTPGWKENPRGKHSFFPRTVVRVSGDPGKTTHSAGMQPFFNLSDKVHLYY